MAVTNMCMLSIGVHISQFVQLDGAETLNWARSKKAVYSSDSSSGQPGRLAGHRAPGREHDGQIRQWLWRQVGLSRQSRNWSLCRLREGCNAGC